MRDAEAVTPEAASCYCSSFSFIDLLSYNLPFSSCATLPAYGIVSSENLRPPAVSIGAKLRLYVLSAVLDSASLILVAMSSLRGSTASSASSIPAALAYSGASLGSWHRETAKMIGGFVQATRSISNI
jgi:hypothetical protein